MTSSAAVHEFFATSLAAYALFDGPGERSPNIHVRALSGQSRLLARFVERDRTGKFREAVTRLGLTASQQAKVRAIFDESEPLIAELEHDYEAVGRKLEELTPNAHDYEVRLAVLSARRGALTTLLALAGGQLRSRVFTMLSTSQQALLPALREAWADNR